MPNIKRLMQGVAYTLKKRAVLPSLSAVNWASMFMGAGPELHGYTEWGSKTPELPSRVVTENNIFPTIFGLLRKADSKAEIQNIFRDLAKQAVSEVMQSPVERKMFLNKSEAQAYIGVSYATLQKLIAQGLPVIQIDGKILLSKVSINEFLKSIEK